MIAIYKSLIRPAHLILNIVYSRPRVDRGQDFRPRPRKIQLVKTEAEDNRGFFFLTEAEEFWQKNC